MIIVKDNSVRIAHLAPGMVIALQVADAVYGERGYDCVITSGNDGRHSADASTAGGNW